VRCICFKTYQYGFKGIEPCIGPFNDKPAFIEQPIKEVPTSYPIPAVIINVAYNLILKAGSTESLCVKARVCIQE
jgi:hypothetical protein